MKDIHQFIQSILDGDKLSLTYSGDTEYKDQPIIRPASQLNNYLPERCRAMRRLALSPSATRYSDTRIFYEQALMMADYEDEFDYHGQFSRYYPTYQSMNDMQLRGYFGWRTRLRRGELQQTQISFAFVYMYELLHLIGCANEQDGYDRLLRFRQDYSALDARIDAYARRWLHDFAVYYNLPPQLLQDLSDTDADENRLLLLQGEQQPPEKLFGALCEISSYNLQNSRFFREYPEDVREVTVGVYYDLVKFYGKNHKYSLNEKLFGRLYKMPCTLFYSAVFYDVRRHEHYEYRESPLCVYRCDAGSWSCERLYGNHGKNHQLGEILKSIDRIMRREYHFAHPLKDSKTTKILQSSVLAQIEALRSRRAELARPKIELDLSKLDEIRARSLQTRDRLIVEPDMPNAPEEPHAYPLQSAESKEPTPSDENKEPAFSAADKKPTQSDANPEPSQPSDDTGLTDGERAVLHCLLYGGSAAEAAARAGMLLSVAADNINERLFELLGDTAIIFEGEKPQIIEDYIQQLKGIIPE